MRPASHAAACAWALLLLAAHASASDLLGEPGHHRVHPADTLLDIARRRGVGYIAMRIANPGIDPWLPEPGRVLDVPTQHLLPNAPRRGIVLNLPELRLYWYGADGRSPESFAISIGDEGKETPLGITSIVRKATQPSWVPTASARQENPSLPTSVAPGPDNPMGHFALYLGWRGYAIHGTNRPYSIGRRGSHGCIRLLPEDIERLYSLAAPGTPVRVIDQRAKVGWHQGQLYLEVHPDLRDLNAIEAGDGQRVSAFYDARELVAATAGQHLARVDWDTVLSAGLEQNGMPVPVLRSQASPQWRFDRRQ